MTCAIPGMCSRSPACHDHDCPGHPREPFWVHPDRPEVQIHRVPVPSYAFWAVVALLAIVFGSIGFIHVCVRYDACMEVLK